MCGFVGFMGGIPLACGDEQLLSKMSRTLIHRGPDDGGFWYDSDQRIGLGHRRLAVVDLSPTGRQPMASGGGRYVIAFNGEIYNHAELRKELGGIVKSSPGCSASGAALGENSRWRGHSDTETLLAGIEAWGLEQTLKRSVGMFALALWDRQTCRLSLARDRMGEKPLYYGWQGNGNQRTFLFASELKAFKAHPGFAADIDRGALCLLLRHNYIPAPYSIYCDIAKLTPGCVLSISVSCPDPEIVRYWDLAVTARAAVAKPFAGTANEAVDALEVMVKDATRLQMTADVPLGAFLSGGVDSATVVALMQAQSSRPVKTFTIGFTEADHNEASYAKAVARHLGTDHLEFIISPQEALDVIPRLPDLYCEPFADSSQIPTFLVSQMARQQVTVSLSGDAGDELFCGYDRYHLTNSQWEKLSLLPLPLRVFAAQCVKTMSPNAWDRFARSVLGIRGAHMVGHEVHKRAGKLASSSADDLYLNVVSHFGNPTDWVIDGCEPPTCLTGQAINLSGLNPVQRMMAVDAVSYLPDDILVKVDRAAMGVSLETRVPFLDHRVVELAWQLPLEYKQRNGQSKWALREVLYRYVPRALIDRPKQGFSVPLQDWLRGPLRAWAESLLDETRLQSEGYFRPKPIRQMWESHLRGQKSWKAQLWNILMFQAWLEGQRE